jgi:hypothetical protein
MPPKTKNQSLWMKIIFVGVAVAAFHFMLNSLQCLRQKKKLLIIYVNKSTSTKGGMQVINFTRLKKQIKSYWNLFRLIINQKREIEDRARGIKLIEIKYAIC